MLRHCVSQSLNCRRRPPTVVLQQLHQASSSTAGATTQLAASISCNKTAMIRAVSRAITPSTTAALLPWMTMPAARNLISFPSRPPRTAHQATTATAAHVHHDEPYGYDAQADNELEGEASGRLWGSLSKEDPSGHITISHLLHHKWLSQTHYLAVHPEDTVLSAVEKMASANTGSLLVLTHPPENDVEGPVLKGTGMADLLVGIMTERDYLTKVVVQGRASNSTKVSEIMTGKSQLLVLHPDDSLQLAMKMMSQRNIRHLPVVQQDHLMGVVSMRDVMSAIVRSQRADMEQMRNFIQSQDTYSAHSDPVA